MALLLKKNNVVVTTDELQEVIDAVEELGAHPRLTDIVYSLSELQQGRSMTPRVNRHEDFKICEGVQCR